MCIRRPEGPEWVGRAACSGEIRRTRFGEIIIRVFGLWGQRNRLTAKRSRPEMAPQRLEKIESAPGNGMGSEASNPQDLVHGRATDRARLRLTNRKNDKVGKLQKKAPKALKSLDAELKSAPVPRGSAGRAPFAGRRLRTVGRPTLAPRRLSHRKSNGSHDGEGNFPACKALKNHETAKESRFAARTLRFLPRAPTPPSAAHASSSPATA